MKKKSFVMLLCAAVIATSAAFGTVAYLTSTSEVVNKFTVGNVSIKVDETDVNPDGTPVEGAPRVEDGNEYHLLPGQTYVKDPTITVSATSESSYIRMLVTISKATELQQILTDLQTRYPQTYPYGLPQEHVQGWDPATWVYTSTTPDTTANTVTYEFRYQDADTGNQIVTPDGSVDLVLDALFDSITVPGELTGEQLSTIADLEINVVGQAIQATGFADADTAWAAFTVQTTPVTTTANQQANAEPGV